MTGDGELRFSITRIDPGATRGLQGLVCQHHTSDLAWRPETMVHTNRAARLSGIFLPQASVLSGLAQDAGEDGVLVEIGEGRLVLTGEYAQSHDLRQVCGIELEIITA